jgi:hypothetical protein
MRLAFGLLLAISMLTAPSQAQDGTTDAEDGFEDFGTEPEEVIVYGDRFARWDGTRWHARTQIGFPVPYILNMRLNKTARFVAMEIDSVIACEKRWRRGPKQFEVDCIVEDFAVRAVPFLMGNDNADDVLSEFDTALTGALIQLHVTDDGRVANVDLENTGLRDIRRERLIHQTYRQLMLRLVSGFHMKLPPSSQLHEGQWVEYSAPVFQIPGYRIQGRSGSHLIHQLDKYKGQLVVQSVGKATVEMPLETGEFAEADFAFSADGAGNFFKVDYEGVSIYDKNSGIMTERVWSMRGKATASSQLADGWGGTMYFQLGRLRKLGDDEKVDLGKTTRTMPPGMKDGRFPTWKPFDK